MSLRVIAMLLVLIPATIALPGCAHRSGARGAAPSPTNVPGANLSRGKTLYTQQCAACHGVKGTGGEIGPPLANERAKKTYEGVRAIVLDPAPPMPKLYPGRMTKADVRDVSAYVETL